MTNNTRPSTIHQFNDRELDLIRENVQLLFDWLGENPNYRGFIATPVLLRGLPTYHIELCRSKDPFGSTHFRVTRDIPIESALAFDGTLLKLKILEAICEMEKTETIQ